MLAMRLASLVVGLGWFRTCFNHVKVELVIGHEDDVMFVPQRSSQRPPAFGLDLTFVGARPEIHKVVMVCEESVIVGNILVINRAVSGNMFTNICWF